MAAPTPSSRFNACASCGQVMDVSAAEPFSQQACRTCGTMALVRTHFDHFTILREVGVGGMSRVFEAEDISLGRRVALKILNRECSQDATRLAQFEREARLTASFSHPHIVKVYSVGRDQNLFYIAMELVPGGSLDDRTRQAGAQPEEEMLRMATEVVQGLRTAQGKGLIHRDIKPGNILFAEDGTAKIVDFGLALIQGDRDNSEELWATPYYVPPEKLYGEADTYRGDMYSLGAALFHALAGKPPYTKDTNSIEELKRVKSFAVHLRPASPNLSDETCAIIDRLLSRKPEHRYRSYDELLEHFQFARQKLLARAAQSRQPPWRRFLARHGALAAALAIGLGLAVLLAVRRTSSEVGAGPRLAVNSESSAPGESATARYLQARENLSVGLVPRARSVFEDLANAPTTRQPTLNWALVHTGLCALLENEAEPARRAFSRLSQITTSQPPGPTSADASLHRFFNDLGHALGREGRVPTSEDDTFSGPGLHGLGLLPLGLRAWVDGQPARAESLLRQFMAYTPPAGQEWIEGYRRLAAPYLEDFDAQHKLPVVAEAAEAAEHEKAIATTQALLASMKVPGGPLRPQMEAHADQLRSRLTLRQRDQEERLSADATEQAREEAAALDRALAQIDPWRADYDFARGVEVLHSLSPWTPSAQARVADHVFLWQAAEDFLRLLAQDLNTYGFAGTLERRPPFPPVAGATIGRASRDKWLVRAGKIETTLPLSATTPAFLIALAEQFVDRASDSDGYYRRREALVAFAQLAGMGDYARFAAELLMRESPTFRDRWNRLAVSSLGV
ncbi:MAG: serine/threonine-protein kinase [Verrucomicrobiales bacterium]